MGFFLRVRDGIIDRNSQESRLLVGLRLHSSLVIVDTVHARAATDITGVKSS